MELAKKFFDVITGPATLQEGDLSHLKTCSSSHRWALDFFAIRAWMVGATGMAGMKDICMAQRSKRDHLQSVHKRYQ